MTKWSKRVISIVLVLSLVFTMIPMNAVAEGISSPINNSGPGENPVKKSEGKIIGEVIEKREANVKHFIKDDGTFEAAIYRVPVHYLEDGQWKEIDNTLVDNKDEDNNDVMENTHNDFKIKLGKNVVNSKLVRIQKGNYELSWNMEGAQEAVAKKVEPNLAEYNALMNDDKKRSVIHNDSGVNFINVLPDTDLNYTVNGNMVKENIIINKNSGDGIFSFNLATKKLIPILQKDKSIILFDEKDLTKGIFKIPSPIMYDAGHIESKDIEVFLDKTSSGYKLSLKPNKDWLNSPERVFPVVVDPVVSTSTEWSSIHDTWIASGLPNENKDNSVLLGVGYGSASQITRTFIKFDLPTLSSADLVTNAKLWLSLYSGQANYRQVNVHRVNENWYSTTLTWNNAPGYNPKVEDYAVVHGVAWDQFSWDVTGIVKDWYATGNNYGLMLKHQDESVGYNEFLAADSYSAYSSYRPQVTLQYINNSGLESYWTYHSQSIGRAGTSYVNDYNGNLILVHNDLSMSGNRMPITLNHVFNSNDKDTNANTGNYGLGWRLNVSQKIESQTIEKTQYYVYTDEDGTKHYFSYDSASGTYKDVAGPDLTLTLNGDGTYVIKDKKDNRLTFTSSGYLYLITDRNGNTLTLSYNGATLYKITDGAGRITNLDINQYGYLIGIIDPSGRRTSFGYNGAQLTTITYPDGKQTVYTYDASNKLLSAKNYDGYTISYQYFTSAPYRVQKVTESHTDGTQGGELSLSYGYNTTLFTDVKGRKETYQFNDSGNTISVKDPNGSAEYSKYDTGSNSNKLALESKLQSTVINLLKNHNAELSGYWNADYWTGSTGSSNFTNEDKYLGNQSLKVNKTNTSSRQFFNQTINLVKDKTYTFSAYVKTNNISSVNSKGAALFVNYQDSAGNWQTIESKYINGTNGYDRQEVTFTLPSDSVSTTVYARAGIIEETGTAYFDSLQLEEGSTANRYNLIENASFEFDSGVPLFWSTSNCDANDTSVSGESALGSRSVGINGVANQSKNFNQTINVSGQANDVFVVSGWAKGSSVPLKTGNGRYFALDVGIHKTDGTYQWNVVSFNEDATDWQYASDKVIASGPYTDITFYVLYYNEANTAYFDGLQLYKEEFGQSYTHDSKGNIVSSVDLAKQQSSFQYTGNDLTKAIDPKGSQFNYTYDSKHNVKTGTSAMNVVYSFDYDSYGNPLTAKVADTTNTLFTQTSSTYTSSGNYLQSMTNSSGNTVTNNWDETKGLLSSTVDAKQKETNYSYYPNTDQLQSVSKNVGANPVTNSYTYENDRLKTINHNGFNYAFGYDSFGNNTTVAVGSQNLSTNTYETVNGHKTGRLNSSTYGNGQVVSNDYDTLDRIIGKRFNNTLRYSYLYDGSGNLGYQKDIVNGVDHRYVYDAANRLVQVVDSNKNNFKYGYDSNNNTNSFSDTINGITHLTSFQYDNDNKPKSVSYAQNQINYNYDSIGRLDNRTLNTGTYTYTTKFNYLPGINGSSTNRISSVINDSTKAGGSQISYTYDANGNIETIAQNAGSLKYYYNELNELTREDNQVLNKTIVYDYDAGGNTTSKAEYPYTTGTPSNPNKTYSYTYGDANWKDKLTNFDGKAISYDAIGNPTGYDGWTYTWEEGRQLASMSKTGQSLSFKYNDTGIRTEKTVNGVTTKYRLVGDKVTNEETGTNTYKYDYAQNVTWAYHGFDIAVNTTKSYTYSFDAYISPDANIADTGTTFIADGENGFRTTFDYDNTKKGTWQHFEVTQVPTTTTAYIFMYPSTSTIPATIGYILYRNVQFKEAGSSSNLFGQPSDNSGFTVKGNGVFQYVEHVVNDDNTYKYNYSQNVPWTYHGFDIAVNTTKSYTYSFDAYISPDANIADTGTTFIADGENGFRTTFDYDNTKKGTWQHFEVTQVPTSTTAYIFMYPTTSTIPATTGYILYRNVQFKEAGSSSNLFGQPLDSSGFSIRGNGVFECILNDRIYYTYDATGQLISMNLNGTEYYYIRNAQGDVIGLFDSTGTRVVSYTYDSWGKLVSTTGTLSSTVGVKNPYLYRGYRYDTETGLYYLQSRYYNPDWGRFINADSLGGEVGELLSHNIFAYCDNNPVDFVDPEGTFLIALPLIAGADILVNALTVVVGAAIIADSVTHSKSEPISESSTSDPVDRLSGPVVFHSPVGGASQVEMQQIRNYVFGCNLALRAGYLSPTGRVPTSGRLSDLASSEADKERNRASKAGTPYGSPYVVGHVPDTTWTGNPIPYLWMPLDGRINSSLGRQSQNYPIGYKPTLFLYIP